MPYFQINKCLPATVDIRLQYRYSAAGTELSRTTYFNKTEVLRLLQMHYMLTKDNTVPMNKLNFIQFMDVFLGVRNVDAVDKIYLLCSETNREYMTGPEFVKVLSMILKGTLADLINFCFEVYTEMIRSPKYIKKEDVLLMARRNSMKMCKLVNMDEYDQRFVEFVMAEVDKDRDNRISLEDYRKAVHENVAWLQFLGQILPECSKKQRFMRLFTDRPYVNNIESTAAAMTRKNRESIAKMTLLKSTISQAENVDSSTSFSSNSTFLVINHDMSHVTKKNQLISDGSYSTLF
ncbi:PREDICTED: EF-hand calcium-binding domain-containing protein 1-like [Diuraphis noxia]|uniref:EF-hand calcium-binding domain-containing protein 1-like n=1 Tax=Diuraphis noxia TaxID=143948 RepID=UPI000763853E|nr:PREDICTED: EF-hand calcium-binding domain-containing protein 1-like [Diuraphis noxia]